LINQFRNHDILNLLRLSAWTLVTTHVITTVIR